MLIVSGDALFTYVPLVLFESYLAFLTCNNPSSICEQGRPTARRTARFEGLADEQWKEREIRFPQNINR